MKSGLEDRNNCPHVQGDVLELLNLSMKSGLEDRNNFDWAEAHGYYPESQ